MMRRIQSFFRIGLLLLCSLQAVDVGHAQNPSPATLDAYIEKARQEWNVPGLAVAVVKDDSVVFIRGYGVRDLGRPERVDENTVFELTSATKSFTASAIGILVGEGKLGWDDPVAKHLPNFRLHDPYLTRELTIRDLLAHRTGLIYDSSVRDGPFTRAQLVQKLAYMKPRHSFRSGFSYNHIPYVAVAEILERTTGQSWDDFVAERIFAPLGMPRTNTTIQAAMSSGNSGTPHEVVDGEMRPVEWIDRDNVGPALSLNSTAHDLAQWLRMHLNGGSYAGRQVLTPAVVAEMQTPQTLIRLDDIWRDGRPFSDFYPEAHLMAHGLGWFIHDYRGHKAVEYFGRFAEIAMLPEERLGVVILMNTPADLRYALMFWLFDQYLGAGDRDWSTEMLRATIAAREERERSAPQTRPRAEGTRPSLSLSGYAGRYQDTLYGEVNVTERDGTLFLHYSPIRGGVLEHWENDTFLITWTQPRFGKSLVTFTVDPSGKVQGMRVQGLTSFQREP
jgi:CubicO group peptidase (beta-lactamase class C family)